MRILVTGARGFIGKYLLDRLGSGGDKTFGFARGDGLDRAFSEAKPEAVVHAAGSLLGIGPARAAEGYLNNVSLTADVVRAAIGARARRFVFLSSNMVYGDSYRVGPGDEDRAEPKNWYARSKLLCERLLADQSGLLETVVLRLPSVLAAWKKGGDPVTDMARALKKDGVIRVFGKGLARRQFLDIRDLADAVALSLRKELPGPFAIVPVVAEEARPIRDIARMIVSARGSGRLEFDPGVPEPPDQEVDPQLARAKLGFRPRFSLEDSIREVLVQDAMKKPRRTRRT